jgi:hypothetical protein
MEQLSAKFKCGERVVALIRELIQAPAFRHAHRRHRRCFTRVRTFTFSRVMLLVLQKTLRSIQLHLHDFLAQLGRDVAEGWATAGAWTQARAKLRYTAFMALNQQALLGPVYGGETDFEVRRWRGWRVMAIDSSLVRLPSTRALGRIFGWVRCENQTGPCGRYVQGRLSVCYDVLNRIGVDAQLVNWHQGERQLGLEHLAQAQADDLILTDRGYASYEWFAAQVQAHRPFVCRCEANSFEAVRQLFAANEAGQSLQVQLRPPANQQRAIREAGLPEVITVRLVSFRLPDGSLEVLATSLLDEAAYPTQSLYELYGRRWGVETYFDVLKGRLALENFSGKTVEAVRQDTFATVLLSNLESVITRPAQGQLDERTQRQHPAQVNRAVAFHAIKAHLIALLLSQEPIASVLEQLEQVFLQNPCCVRKERAAPPRRKRSAWVSYQFQRNKKKAVF